MYVYQTAIGRMPHAWLSLWVSSFKRERPGFVSYILSVSDCVQPCANTSDVHVLCPPVQQDSVDDVYFAHCKLHSKKEVVKRKARDYV